MTRFSATTTADEVVAALKEQIAGKTILITGVTPGGLGATSAIALAAASPALLILAGRNPTKNAETAATIASAYPKVATRTLTLDLGSLASISAAVSSLNDDDVPKIDVLLNNAAVMACPHFLTTDGLEGQFGTNHIGHFHLTTLLLPKLTPNSGRVINVSSRGHLMGTGTTGIHWDDINFSNGANYDKFEAYAQAKTANILFSVALAKRGVVSFSLHPGSIATNLQRHVVTEEMQELRERYKHIARPRITVQQGAATQLVACFDPDVVVENDGKNNGGYLDMCQIAQPAPFACDAESAERLWKLSEDIVAEKLAVVAAAAVGKA